MNSGNGQGTRQKLSQKERKPCRVGYSAMKHCLPGTAVTVEFPQHGFHNLLSLGGGVTHGPHPFLWSS